MAGHQLLCWHVVRQSIAAPHWHLAEAPAEAGSRLMLTLSLPHFMCGPGSFLAISGSGLGEEVRARSWWLATLSLLQHLGQLIKAKGEQGAVRGKESVRLPSLNPYSALCSPEAHIIIFGFYSNSIE